MEDGLVHENGNEDKANNIIVLILVVMEDGLVRRKTKLSKKSVEGLNPCCNGRWSRTNILVFLHLKVIGLNPCCNGRWSRTICRENIAQIIAKS